MYRLAAVHSVIDGRTDIIMPIADHTSCSILGSYQYIAVFIAGRTEFLKFGMQPLLANLIFVFVVAFLGFSTVLGWPTRTSDLRLFTMDKCLTERPASTLLSWFASIVFRSITLSDVPLTYLYWLCFALCYGIVCLVRCLIAWAILCLFEGNLYNILHLTVHVYIALAPFWCHV